MKFKPNVTRVVQFVIVLLFIFASTIQLQSQWGDVVGENVQLTSGAGLKTDVIIEPAPEDGWYVSYTVSTPPNKNVVHLARVDSVGNILWDNIIHDLSDAWIPKAQMISDDAGGVIMAWEDNRDDANVFVYANRIAPDGTKMWGDDDKRVGVSESSDGCPKLISDGENGAFVTMVDGNPPPGDFIGLYAYRVDSLGNTLWRNFLFRGVNLCTTADFDSDGEGGLLAFYIFSHAFEFENQFRGMRLDTAGNKLWTDETFDIAGFQVPIGMKFYGTMDALSDLNIHFAPSIGTYALYLESPFGGGVKTHQGHLIDLDAIQLWDANGIPLNAPSDLSSIVKTAIDQDGNLYFNYDTDSDWELQKVLPDGSLPWTIDGIPYSSAFQGGPDNLVITSCNDVMMAFDGVNEIIHTSRIDGNGSMVFNPDMKALSVDEVGDQHRDPVIAINGNDRVLVVWADDENVNDSEWDLKMHGFHKDNPPSVMTSIFENEIKHFSIFPNPISKGSPLQIQTESSQIEKIALLDLTGKKVIDRIDLSNSDNLLNIKIPNEVSAGIYFLQLSSQDGVFTKKIIIQ